MFAMALMLPLALVAVVLLVDAARAWTKTGQALDPPITALLSAARQRIVWAVLTATVVIMGLFVLNGAFPSILGLPLVLAPTLGGVAGLIVYASIPPQVPMLPDDAVRLASLDPRTPLSFLPRGRLRLAVVALVLLVGVLVFTGVTSSRDDLGHFRAFTARYVTDDGFGWNRASPYPGWFYAVPMLAATGGLVLATMTALRRISATPALPQPDMAELDAAWRRATNSIIVGLVTVLVLVQLQASALSAGSAIVRTITPLEIDGAASSGWILAGWVLMAIGLGAFVAALIVLVTSLRELAQLPVRVLRRADATPPPEVSVSQP